MSKATYKVSPLVDIIEPGELQFVWFEEWDDEAHGFENFVKHRRAAIASDLDALVGIKKEPADG